MRKIILYVLIISFIFIFACGKKENQKGPYLAKINGSAITQADFEKEFNGLPDFAQKMFEGEAGKDNFLNELINKELLYQEALKKGLDKDQEYVQKVEDFKKLNLVSLLLEKEIEANAAVSDKEVKDYYEKNKEKFKVVSQLRASHILVKTEKEATQILTELKKDADFAKIAKKSSIDRNSAKKGGDIGFFSKGEIVPEFELAAIKLNVGEISEPVKSGLGYHIIKLTDKKIGEPPEFEKVKGFVSQRLSAENQKQLFDSYIKDLKKKYKTEINREALSALTLKKVKEDKKKE